jgi:hypothetical protein
MFMPPHKERQGGARRRSHNLEYAPLAKSWAASRSLEVQLLGAGHRQHGSAALLRTEEQKVKWLRPLMKARSAAFP